MKKNIFASVVLGLSMSSLLIGCSVSPKEPEGGKIGGAEPTGEQPEIIENDDGTTTYKYEDGGEVRFEGDINDQNKDK